jgi:hypothetical protein
MTRFTRIQSLLATLSTGFAAAVFCVGITTVDAAETRARGKKVVHVYQLTEALSVLEKKVVGDGQEVMRIKETTNLDFRPFLAVCLKLFELSGLDDRPNY